MTKSSPKIDCSNRGLMFIRNMDTYYVIDKEENLLNQTTKFETHYDFKEIRIDKEVTMNAKFFSYENVEHLTILSLLSRSINSLAD